MDVFELRRKLVEDYGEYATSFVDIGDKRIREHVDEELLAGLLWPEPLVQLNPAFEPGGYVDELVRQGLLHQECAKIFRAKDDVHDQGKPLRLHRHQVDAIKAAQTGGSYILTTGTGSGKSLAYIVPIVDWVLRNGPGRGIKAIVVYPMNALANSQMHELEKFLNYGYPNGRGLIRFARYTGQENDEQRNEIVANPPDVLLTNYVMLELILTRPHDKKLIQAAKGLQFLVFDELHTYRGRQGADVALLARRTQQACGVKDLQFVGTSATLATAGTYDERRAEVARVGSQLFGVPIDPENVIGETLRQVTPETSFSDEGFKADLKSSIESYSPPAPDDPKAFELMQQHPLSAWVETALGVYRERHSERLIRQMPRPLEGRESAAEDLSKLTGLPKELCADVIRRHLLVGYHIRDLDGFRAFAFRLHQFVSRGETVFASLESPAHRYITTEGQRFVPNDRDRIMLPLAFCRECGQDYYTVWLHEEGSLRRVTDRDMYERAGDESGRAGFILVPEGDDWPADLDLHQLVDRIPEDWLEVVNGVTRIKSSFQKLLPRSIRLGTSGAEAEGGTDGWFLPAPFRFCLHCGVAYSGASRSDFGKLATLGSGGRGTATTILSLSAIRGLRHDDDLTEKARKLLSFTDNRQDASLQAGHFNDFIQNSLIRSALYKALIAAGDAGLTHEVLAQKVFEALALPFHLYSVDPEVKFAAKTETEKALRDVIGYRVYRDLMRGWRVTSPNLEQSGLLTVEYSSLDELSGAEEEWESCHPALASASPATRAKVATVLLDFIRRELAIKVEYLDNTYQEQLQLRSSAKLVSPWSIDDGEELERSRVVFPRSRGASRGPREWVFLSTRGGFGQFIRRHGTFPETPGKLKSDDTEEIFKDLLGRLKIAGLVEIVMEPQHDGQVPGYQVPASALVWKAADGSKAFHDPIRVPRAPEEGRRPNPFFVGFYKTIAEDAKDLQAREHTAQVPPDVREEREEQFRDAKLPILFCSPTMELGVDIAELNAVNMRNVPPTPANYAQRSGRAGRSGQPALVFTYCATGSPHDQYYFRRQREMVSGQVAPPRIDLTNEDLVRSHVHSVWLAETGASLGWSLKDVLAVDGADSLDLLPSLRSDLESATAQANARTRADAVLGTLQTDLVDAPWYTEAWLDSVLAHAVDDFDRAADRWRGLYRAALAQREAQHKIIGDQSKSPKDKDLAKRLRREAESQLELLTADTSSGLMQSDFYSYRYFASEGFLPGYSFPRLPLSAYIPGRRRMARADDEFISRPRFLAISEFGPRAFLYHEGSRYIINRVILPIDEDAEESGLSLRSAKWCATCGYLHPVTDGVGADVCERCNSALGLPRSNLFRMQNVATRRRDRISSDEEERMRQGFELRTGIRFSEHGGQPSFRVATVEKAGDLLARLTYGAAAQLWRVNLGWRRQVRHGEEGFTLDTQNGYWARNEANPIDVEDPMSPSRQKVVPFVEDRRNCLLVDFEQPLDGATFVSIQAALARAIGAEFQLEDRELASEPLPDRDRRSTLLLYESAEGGAGVLRRLVEDPGALGRVAFRALEICHYEPSTGDDLGKAPHARQRCEAACYDCLMSYTNQMDHDLLDRQLLPPVLRDLHEAMVRMAPAEVSRAEHLAKLKNLCDSELERKWLDLLEERNLTLPDKAQLLIEDCGARPDFYYGKYQTAVYIDGPVHQFEDRQKRDVERQTCLEDLGYSVIRFGGDDDWNSLLEKNPQVFGVNG